MFGVLLSQPHEDLVAEREERACGQEASWLHQALRLLQHKTSHPSDIRPFNFSNPRPV
jgi:hypothetical protein